MAGMQSAAAQPNGEVLARLREQYGNGNVIDPLDNPYFGTSEGRGQRGDGRVRFGSGFSMGNADGSGFYDFSGIPGAEAFVPQDDGRGNGQGIDPQALATWLQQKGYVMRQGDDPQTNTSMRWIEDAQGNIVGQPQQFDNTDQQFSNAIKAAALITGANVVTALPGLQAAQAAAAAGGTGGGAAGAAGAAGAGGAGTATLGATGAMATPVATSAALPTIGTVAVPTASSLGIGAVPTLGAASAGMAGAAGAGGSSAGAATQATARAAEVAGYGGGMTGAQTSVYDGILNATGSTGLAGAAAANPTIAAGLDTIGGYLPNAGSLTGNGAAGNWANLIGAGLTAGAVTGATTGNSGSTTPTTGTAAAQSGVANDARTAGNDAMAWFRQAYEDQRPGRDAAVQRGADVSNAQFRSMEFANNEAADLANYQRTTFRPIEQRIASDAMAYDSPGRRMQAAAAAAADQDVSAAATQQATNRSLSRMGVAPGSSKALAAREDNNVAQSVGRGASMTQAVRDVERTGNERLMQAAGVGNAVAGRQVQQQGIGLQAGNASAATASNALRDYQSGNSLMQTGFNTQLQGLSTAGNLFNGVAAGERADRNAADANARDDRRDLITGIGQVGQFVGNLISEKGKKKGTGKMADSAKALEEVEGTPVHEGWEYDPKKGGPDDGGMKHTGPMAGDVRRTMGEKAAPGGKMIDPVTMNGRMLAAVQELSKRVKALETEMA
jgi:hypothetical protein